MLGQNSRRRLAYGLVVVFFLLRYDLWAEGAGFVLGLPAVLTYHFLYCLAAAAVLALLVRLAWPEELHDPAEDGP